MKKSTSPFSAKAPNKKQTDKKEKLAVLKEKVLASQPPLEPTQTPKAQPSASLKSWKTKVKKLTQKTQFQEEKWKQEKAAHMNTKETLQKTREKLYHTQAQLSSGQQEASYFKNELEAVMHQMRQMKEEIEQLHERNYRLEKSLHQYKTQAASYKGMFKPLQKKIKELIHNEELHQLEQDKWQQSLLLHKEEINKLKAAKSQQAQQLSQWKNLAPKRLLEHLYENLSLKNHYEYHTTVSLHRKFRWMQGTIRRQHSNQNQQFLPIFGTLEKRQEGWWVRETTGEHFKVTDHPPLQLKEGMPILARQNGNRVEVVTIYNDELEQKRDATILQQEKEASTVPTRTEDYVKKFPSQAYEWKILLVTSHNGSHYQQFLTEQGFKAEWINPYEKSTPHVHQRIIAHDLVMLDLAHIPHVVTNLLAQEENIRIQRFTTFRKKSLLARILYVASNS